VIQSEQIGELATALAKAQGELVNIAKEKTVDVVGRSGGRRKWMYADLGDGLDEIRKKLSKHGLSFVQMTTFDDMMIAISTQIMHTSGQWIRGTYPVCPLGQEHQQTGAAITYARRYTLFTACGVVGVEDDDDGESAGKTPTRGKPRAVDPPPVVLDPEESAGLRNAFEQDLMLVKDMEGYNKLIANVRLNEDRITPPDRKILASAFNRKVKELEEL
jgi:ERF superfamily